MKFNETKCTKNKKKIITKFLLFLYYFLKMKDKFDKFAV